MNITRTINPSELINALTRSTIGLESLVRDFTDLGRTANGGFPPYNIEALGDDKYRLTLAVAGFSKDEIDVSVEDGNLVIEGRKVKDPEATHNYIYQGIAERDFTRKFKLMEYVVITSASLTDGMLVIDLERELPEALKPRKIEIN